MRALLVLLLATAVVSGCLSTDQPAPTTGAPQGQSKPGPAPVNASQLFPMHIRGHYLASIGCSPAAVPQLPPGQVSDLAPVDKEAWNHTYTTSGSATVNTAKCLVWLDAAGNAVAESPKGKVPQHAAKVFVTALADAAQASYDITIV